MARARYIYVVIVPDLGKPTPEAVFTVKWEMVKWIESNDLPSDYEIWRYSDGLHRSDPVLMRGEDGKQQLPHLPVP